MKFFCQAQSSSSFSSAEQTELALFSINPATRSTPLPTRSTPLPTRSTPLPVRSTPLPTCSTSLPTRSTPFPHSLSISSFSVHFLILSPFPHFLSISSLSRHFLILSPFPLNFLIFSPFALHFLILSPFPRSRAARLQRFLLPWMLAAMVCRTSIATIG